MGARWSVDREKVSYFDHSVVLLELMVQGLHVLPEIVEIFEAGIDHGALSDVAEVHTKEYE